jgi:hypothetical protein
MLASALLHAVPYEVLLSLSTSSGVRWYFMPNASGGWVFTPLLAVLALFLLRGSAWAPYVVGAVVASLLLVQLSPGVGPQVHNLPLAVARNVVSAVLQLTAFVLVLLPSARRWFRGV